MNTILKHIYLWNYETLFHWLIHCSTAKMCFFSFFLFWSSSRPCLHSSRPALLYAAVCLFTLEGSGLPLYTDALLAYERWTGFFWSHWLLLAVTFVNGTWQWSTTESENGAFPFCMFSPSKTFYFWFILRAIALNVVIHLLLHLFVWCTLLLIK